MDIREILALILVTALGLHMPPSLSTTGEDETLEGVIVAVADARHVDDGPGDIHESSSDVFVVSGGEWEKVPDDILDEAEIGDVVHVEIEDGQVAEVDVLGDASSAVLVAPPAEQPASPPASPAAPSTPSQAPAAPAPATPAPQRTTPPAAPTTPRPVEPPADTPADSDAVDPTLAPELATTGGDPSPTHNVIIVLMTPSGIAIPADAEAKARAAVNTASDFWKNNSGGDIQFTTTKVTAAAGALPAATLCSTSAYSQVWQTALGKIGVAVSSTGQYPWVANQHLVVVVPAGCTSSAGGAVGVGTIGASKSSGGLVLEWGAPAADVFSHELGHNLGLRHANLLNCPTGSADTATNKPLDRCAVVEYGDPFDVMGFAGRKNIGWLSAASADALGLPLNTEKLSATQPSTITLTALEGSQGTRAASVTDPITGETYFIEHRQNASYDQNLGTGTWQYGGAPNFANGYGVRITKQVSGQTSATLKPLNGGTVFVGNSTGSNRAVTFTAGQSFTTVSGALTITVNAINGATAQVTVGQAVSGGTIAVTGTKSNGQTVTAVPSAFTPEPDGYTYQWMRGTAAISGATSAGYKITPSDLGQAISVKVTATHPELASRTVTSAQFTPPRLSFTGGKVTISGTAKSGSTLTANPSTYSPSPSSYGYQWLRNGKAISGATGKTYKLTNADANRQITVTVYAKSTGYNDRAVTSGKVNVAKLSFSGGKASISGTARVGKKLTAKPGSFNPSSGVKYTYQWLRNGKNIARATGSTYTLTRADRRAKITVRITATKADYNNKAVTSGAVRPN